MTNRATHNTISLLSLALLTTLTPAARSQTAPTSPPPPAKTAPAPPAQDPLPADIQQFMRQHTVHRLSLSEMVDKLNWDATTRGVLLIVSPNDTPPYAPRRTSYSPGSYHFVAPPTPTQEGDGQYSLNAVCDFFGRKIVGVDSLSVFAPTTMVALHDRHLPNPDPFANMPLDEKVRLLQSSFTSEQWEKITSPEGIGANDMTTEQRALYLSMLPDPFILRPVTATPTDDNPFKQTTAGDLVTLTAAQREGVRIGMQKQMLWGFQMGQSPGFPMIGRINQGAVDSTPTYQLEYFGASELFDSTNAAYGTTLVEEVPSRAKMSQLPDDAPGLKTAIALGNDANVDALVRRIGRAAGLELYADPRYSERTLYVRGSSSVQAGDLLHALALAVTGTWRRVGTAYVLTDDIEGLGTRYARISDWLSQNALLAQARAADAMQKVDAVPYDKMTHWRDSDPTSPSKDLQKKIDANSDDSPSLFVPMNELPAYTQWEIKAQADSMQRSLQHNANPPPLRTDGVNVGVTTSEVYIVPGISNVVAATDIFFASQRGARLRTSGARYLQKPPAEPPKTLSFPENCPVHALAVAPRTEEDVTQAVALASQHGFG